MKNSSSTARNLNAHQGVHCATIRQSVARAVRIDPRRKIRTARPRTFFCDVAHGAYLREKLRTSEPIAGALAAPLSLASLRRSNCDGSFLLADHRCWAGRARLVAPSSHACDGPAPSKVKPIITVRAPAAGFGASASFPLPSCSLVPLARRDGWWCRSAARALIGVGFSQSTLEDALSRRRHTR
jgi:hypothetical protein